VQSPSVNILLDLLADRDPGFPRLPFNVSQRFALRRPELRFYARNDFLRAGLNTSDHLLQHHFIHCNQEHRRVIRPEQHSVTRRDFRGYSF
jgi:hypothetical protein